VLSFKREVSDEQFERANANEPRLLFKTSSIIASKDR
jgi:hypothetical protein